jgi:Holliday junction resolvasome RuvABC endonuclease subunit
MASKKLKRKAGTKKSKENKKNTRPPCYNIAMKSGILLSLDISTKATGYSLFDIKSKRLLKYGVIKPKVAGISKMKYPEAALYKILDISSKVGELLDIFKPDVIVAEEVNQGLNRISQKSLCAVHFFILDTIRCRGDKMLASVHMVDSDGFQGWRTRLNLRLSDEDKKYNKEARKWNKNNKLKKPIITKKDLAQRYVNAKYGMSFNVVENTTDSDICDAVSLGHAWLHYISISEI